MRLQLKADTVWFNTMPSVILDDVSQVTEPKLGAEISLEHDEILPEGNYEVKVILTGPDGKEQCGSARFTVAHAC